MTETRTLVLCRQCGTQWYLDQSATCTDEHHDHQQYVLHVHRSAVVLPDGTPITAVSFDDRDPYGRDHLPDYGLYLDPRWEPPWIHDHLDWPDFGVPAENATTARSLRMVLERARSKDRVELGCLGGHGRTGTALACLAIMSGQPANGAVAWVRAHYCAQAVETPAQEAFVAEFGD